MKETTVAGLTVALYKKLQVWVRGEIDKIELTPGPQGIPGRPGKRGQSGADGRDGKDGKDGQRGTDGLPGRDGVDGKDGLDGKDGNDGKNGENGRDGKDGKDGRPGLDGKTGPAGKDGAPGRDGKDGKAGKQGAVGPPGKDGVDGLPGKDGSDGRDGKDGDQGIPGPTGKPGRDGKDGIPGKDGKDGADGKDGKDGVSPDIAPVVDKLQKDFNLYRQKLNDSLSTLGGGGTYHILDNADVERKLLSEVTDQAILIYNVKRGKFIVSDIEEVILSLGLETGEGVKYKKLIDCANDYTYIGEALPGTTDSVNEWRIKRVFEDPATGDMTILWAEGTNDFTNNWDDRLTYSYS